MNVQQLADKLADIAKSKGAVDAGEKVTVKLDGETVTTTA